MFLSVDLASKFSAAVLRDDSGEVRWQADSSGKSAKEWVTLLAKVAHGVQSKGLPIHILVEDVPYGVSSQAMTKPVTRLQGMLMLAMDDTEFFFVNPTTWMKDYDGVARGLKGMSKAESLKYRNAKAFEHAVARGYTPPDLVAQWQEKNPDLKPLKKYTADLEKNMTDYVMAFLINDWLVQHKDEYRTLTGVQPPLI